MNDKKEYQIRGIVEAMVRERVVCGASLGFVRPDGLRLYYYGEQGAVSPYIGRPVTAGLYYDLASLSKVIGTTTRILQLVEEEAVGLDTRIPDIQPCFRYPGITVANLLLHDSGLPAEIRDKGNWNRENEAFLRGRLLLNREFITDE